MQDGVDEVIGAEVGGSELPRTDTTEVHVIGLNFGFYLIPNFSARASAAACRRAGPRRGRVGRVARWWTCQSDLVEMI